MARRPRAGAARRRRRCPAPPDGAHDLGQAVLLALLPRSVSASTSASKPSMRRPSISIQGSRASPASRAAWASFASMRSTTKLSWLEASSDSANRKRSRRSVTNSRRVQKKAATPSPPAACRRARRSRESAPHRRQDLHARERARRQAQLLVAARSSAESRPLGWSRNSRSSPFTLKTSACVLAAAPPSAPAGEEAVQQERRVARLGGDAGDARDVDVGAARAVEEVEVGEDGLAVARQADRQPPLHAVEEQRLSRSRARAPRTGGPGSGGTKTSGSTRVTCTWAACRHERRQHALSTRNTSESNLAPSWRARTRSDDAVEA